MLAEALLRLDDPDGARTLLGPVLAGGSDSRKDQARVLLAQLAEVRERLGTDFGVGITGVAGPDPQEDKPPGTVHVAVASPDGAVVHLSMSMNSGRAAVKRRAVTNALLLLRRALLAEA